MAFAPGHIRGWASAAWADERLLHGGAGSRHARLPGLDDVLRRAGAALLARGWPRCTPVPTSWSHDARLGKASSEDGLPAGMGVPGKQAACHTRRDADGDLVGRRYVVAADRCCLTSVRWATSFSCSRRPGWPAMPPPASAAERGAATAVAEVVLQLLNPATPRRSPEVTGTVAWLVEEGAARVGRFSRCGGPAARH